MNKTYRQGQILRLIRAHKIFTQERLTQELAAVVLRRSRSPFPEIFASICDE
jgi:arginine repressor